MHFLHPMIFVTDFSSIHSKRTLPFYFYNPNRLNGFMQKFYVVLHLLLSYFSLNYGGILSWIAWPVVISSKLSSLQSTPLKWKACSHPWNSITFVMFQTDLRQTWAKPKKNTLIAAFLANATSLFVHAPLKGGCIILRCSLRSVSIQFFEDHAKIFHRLKNDFILTCPMAMKLSPLTDFGLKFLKI